MVLLHDGFADAICFFSVNSSDIVCLGAIGATILSVVFHQIFGGTKFQYLNGLNWIGFFAVENSHEKISA